MNSIRIDCDIKVPKTLPKMEVVYCLLHFVIFSNNSFILKSHLSKLKPAISLLLPFISFMTKNATFLPILTKFFWKNSKKIFSMAKKRLFFRKFRFFSHPCYIHEIV